MFDFDFWGLQTIPASWPSLRRCCRMCGDAKFSPRIAMFPPIASEGWEVVPENIYEMLKRYRTTTTTPKLSIKSKIYVTENGAAFVDTVDQSGDAPKVRDPPQWHLQDYLAQVLGKEAREYRWPFCLEFSTISVEQRTAHVSHHLVDYSTQQRILKDSALWMKSFCATLAACRLSESSLWRQHEHRIVGAAQTTWLTNN